LTVVSTGSTAGRACRSPVELVETPAVAWVELVETTGEDQ